MLGLPDGITACLFDLDGVLTDTASVHRKAWTRTFDQVLRDHGDDRPFTGDDYTQYVDGKPRADGVRDFLASRDITLPEGTPQDQPGENTVNGVGNQKNELLLTLLREDGVTVYEGSRRYLEAARQAGLHRVVVSSSANTKQVLEVTGLDQLVEGRIDGVSLQNQRLRGKPAPDSFWAGAALVGTVAAKAAVFEDATSGVQAGRDGRFGFVVGVNRLDQAHASALTEHGATIVVNDLGDLL